MDFLLLLNAAESTHGRRPDQHQQEEKLALHADPGAAGTTQEQG